MRRGPVGDVLKVWLYAAAVVLGGAWLSRWLYQAGKALAEVTAAKQTNALIDAAAQWSRRSEFPAFYLSALLLAALLLLLPWLEWLRLGGAWQRAGRGPWALRLPAGARGTPPGQPLKKRGQGALQLALGFLLTAGIFLLIGHGLVAAGSRVWRDAPLELPALAGMLAVLGFSALVQEIFFRGVVLGIFLRAMRPAAAIALAALLFAGVHSVLPGGMTVPDPEAPGAGWGLLAMRLSRWADPAAFLLEILPLLALGVLLGLARWRTASLALPLGLHAGWLAAAHGFAAASAPLPPPGLLPRLLAGGDSGTGLLLLVGLLMVTLLVHLFTRPPLDDAGCV
jgi:uncharacterized protein